jgi:hypothetical protein
MVGVGEVVDSEGTVHPGRTGTFLSLELVADGVRRLVPVDAQHPRAFWQSRSGGVET